jgi:hypothetical protein
MSYLTLRQKERVWVHRYNFSLSVLPLYVQDLEAEKRREWHFLPSPDPDLSVADEAGRILVRLSSKNIRCCLINYHIGHRLTSLAIEMIG